MNVYVLKGLSTDTHAYTLKHNEIKLCQVLKQFYSHSNMFWKFFYVSLYIRTFNFTSFLFKLLLLSLSFTVLYVNHSTTDSVSPFCNVRMNILVYVNLGTYTGNISSD